jgi:hypothetical protein
MLCLLQPKRPLDPQASNPLAAAITHPTLSSQVSMALVIVPCSARQQYVALSPASRRPSVFLIPGNAGKLELMRDTAADVVGLDWAVDMRDARAALGHDVRVQVGCGGRGKGSPGVSRAGPRALASPELILTGTAIGYSAILRVQLHALRTCG